MVGQGSELWPLRRGTAVLDPKGAAVSTTVSCPEHGFPVPETDQATIPFPARPAYRHARRASGSGLRRAKTPAPRKRKAGEAEFDVFNVYETVVFMTPECSQSLRPPPPLLYEAYRRNIASI
jgi:hypothetical protein